MKPLLDITDVSLSYHSLSGETPALSHISFQLMPGEFLAIVGPSGCGKSTLLNLICGLLRPEQGQILLDGTPVTSGDCRIGYMLQKDHLLEWRTIYKNVLLGLEIRRELTAEKLAYVNQLLSDYGLDKFRSAHPSELSGGMRQRAALIRTLALKPELLLLDEPFSALDSQTRLSVSDDIGRILHQEKKTAILVTHEISYHQQQYIRHQKREKKLVLFLRIFILLFFLVLWEISARTGLIDSFIFSSPVMIWHSFCSMCRDSSIFPHLSVTITETLVSFLFVVVLGAGMAVLLWTCPRLAKITEPYLVVLNSLPKSALAPLLIVWLGANERTIIVCGMSVAIFGSILNLYTGFGEADPEKLKLIETLGGGKKEKLMKIILPSSVPLLLSVMKVNIGLCLVGVIIGEFIGARKGLGYLIIYSSQTFKLTWVLMSIIILCIIAIILYGLLGLIEKRARR